jgi:hypothetical protein
MTERVDLSRTALPPIRIADFRACPAAARQIGLSDGAASRRQEPSFTNAW